jgi:hypothetical protein
VSPASQQPALLVFGREPIPGQAKTRLIPALGAEQAAALYDRLLRHTLSVAGQLPATRRSLWLDEVVPDSAVAAHARRLGFEVMAQHGGDLGRRMEHALSDALGKAASAVLIGSDCPGYSPEYLAAAFAALHDHDAVVGPAADGGYVLIGLRRVPPELFEGLPWGSDTVLEQTRERLVALGWRWKELAVQRDIDEPADLEHLPALLRPPAQP